MTDQSTWYAEWRQNRRLREKLSTPEGQMQEDLEHTLPQSVVADAQKREMWAVHPDVAASSAVFDAVLVLVQTRYLAIRDSAGAKSFGRWFQSSKAEAQELDAWCRKLVGKATKSFNFADKFRAEVQSRIESEAEELYLRFVRSSRQCAFPISSVNVSICEDSPAFSRAMRAVIGTLPGVDAAFWDFAKVQAMPKPITETERWHLKVRGVLDRALKEKADEVSALVGFCGFMADGGREPTRTEEVLALCALCHAFHTSRCRDKSLPDELKLGWKLFRRLSALRLELVRIASAASGWHWIFTKNPDMPQSEVRRVMHEAWQSGTYPRGRINLPWEVWDNDIIDMASMDSYPQVMPDDLFILSADGGKLALWRATK
ncbi:MAG: hypothetical protein SPL41_04580 [Succinivibrionaceae bacterium]|nr:hypothetical protein [Succinivibrionaceae bacterium]